LAVIQTNSVNGSGRDRKNGGLGIISTSTNCHLEFFTFPVPNAVKKEDCVAKCKVCLKCYKYTLTTKGNLLKHLQTKHEEVIEKHKEEQAERLRLRLQNTAQTTLSIWKGCEKTQ
jgi:hypothetical protein